MLGNTCGLIMFFEGGALLGKTTLGLAAWGAGTEELDEDWIETSSEETSLFRVAVASWSLVMGQWKVGRGGRGSPPKAAEFSCDVANS